MKILITGSAGFIAGYLVEDLLAAGHEVVGLDNYSKYGPTEKSYQSNAAYRFVKGDAKDVDLLSHWRPTAIILWPARPASAASPTSIAMPMT